MTTATFSVVHGVLLRPLPFASPDRLMMLAEQWQPRFAHFEATPHDVAAWREHSHLIACANVAKRDPAAAVT